MYFKLRLNIVMVFLMITTGTMTLSAQNVVVSPATGKLIAALTSGTEIGFQNGCSSLWRHNQLPLTITVADEGTLTAGKELANPAGNLNIRNNKLVLLGGKTKDSYMVVSLPRGFRFTGYSIILQNNMNGVDAFGNTWSAIDKYFYETNSSFDYQRPLGVAKDGQGNATMSSKDTPDNFTTFTLSRQGKDMGNRLYFMIHRGKNAFYGVSIKSFELFFTTDKFTVSLDANPSGKTSLITAPFKIHKPELGEIKPNTKNGKTYYSYSYVNVADMIAYNSLYQKDAVDEDGNASEDVAKTKTISCLVNGGKKWFGLGNNTYFVESPTTIKNANGKDMPVGYRITGAKLTCSWGTSSPSGYVITYNNGDEFYYLGLEGGDNYLKFSTTPSVWQMDEDGHLYQGNQYIYINDYGYLDTSSSYAATFTIEDGKLTYKAGGETYYLTYTDGGYAYLANNSSKAVNIFSNSAYTVPASNYTVTLYGTDANNPVQTEEISSAVDSKGKELEVTGLNNDAVMFTVEGLKGNSQALVSVELTMEALNPYIHSLDIVSHDNNSSTTIRQTFTASNFSVRGEHFTFHVPESQKGAWWFSFENLKSDYADNTYYDGKGTGDSRYCFVTSKYYTSNADLYKTEPNAAYTDKVYSETAGDKPFRFSNIDELTNTSSAQDSKYLVEYPFSIDAYTKAGGKFEKFEVADKQSKTAYLFTCDETRYNIAPTTATQHRYYAYYMMDIEIEKKEYTPKFTFKKIYNSSLSTADNNTSTASQWGVEVTTTENDNTGYGYLSLSTIMEGLKNALNSGDETEHLTNTRRQLLYMDLSKLNEVIVSENAQTPPYQAALQKLSPNAIIYLPFGTTLTNTDNCAAPTTKDGEFYATRNIILTDKTPIYIPYKINVPAEHYAKYTRNITISKYGKVQNATLILPFELSINGKGVHTNSGEAGDNLSFTVNTLQKKNCISNEQQGDEINEGKGWYVHFVPYTSSTNHTEANVPYMIDVTDVPTDNDVSFTALQYGSNIMPTQVGLDGTITLKETCTGTYDGKAITLTPKATYSGTQVNKITDKCFYWGNNVFNSSWTLSDRYKYVDAMPFRAWLACQGVSTAKAATLYAVFGENTTPATGISSVEQSSNGLKIEGTTDALTIVSPSDCVLDIHNTQGMLFKRVALRAGEQVVTSLPSGIYLVAGKKVIVK